jgi:hypothetical protein
MGGFMPHLILITAVAAGAHHKKVCTRALAAKQLGMEEIPVMVMRFI